MPDDLRTLAAAATPGPWEADTTRRHLAHVTGPDGDGVATARGNLGIDPDRIIAAEDNARFIAAANPRAILALIAERDELREWSDNARKAAEELKSLAGAAISDRYDLRVKNANLREALGNLAGAVDAWAAEGIEFSELARSVGAARAALAEGGNDNAG